MLSMLSKKNILTELIWESPSLKERDSGYARWLANIHRSHRMYLYRVDDESDSSTLVGYSDNTAPGCEPFAVHLRNLLGDGVYYTQLANDQFYILVIFNGVIVSGTDCVVNDSFFNEMIHQLPDSQFSALTTSEISASQFERIIESCEENQLVYKRKQRLFWTGVGAGVLVLLIASAVFLYSIIAG
ncbi:pilus assembly protein [Scandinavium sp. V105_16]|uniref:Pilus assembly protein n=1 Tax=Scandinavium lactucae TaxID=3095028 RepID=A0AAJ2S2E7_9ENTR|nr:MULTISPECIES: pilus assembly protein [unclassified Scandinavium]MDX6019667.1 pilus assembly protein [Scandinavium sp. V105_16]MDX6032674.1 pilus assembly protein [Scandinavium sp. V105_12]